MEGEAAGALVLFTATIAVGITIDSVHFGHLVDLPARWSFTLNFDWQCLQWNSIGTGKPPGVADELARVVG